MKVVGLLSGGKDSCYNLCHAAKHGHELVAVATLAPPEGKDELDSYMYQTVGHDAVHLVAQALGVPLYRHVISGTALNQSSSYGSRLPRTAAGPSEAAEDETEDLEQLLLQVKRAHPDVQAVSVGAILSNYQRVRVEHVALRAGLQLLPLAFLWQRDQRQLLREMCDADVRAVLIKVAGIGLDERHLGKTLAQVRPQLERLNDRYGSHICGEGGEYETLTLDCPIFKQRIVLDEVETVIHADSSFASVSYLRVKRAHLEDKPQDATTLEDVAVPPMLDWLGESTRRSAELALSTAAAEPVRLSRPGPSSGAGPSMAVAKRGPWVAVGNVTASSSGSSASASKPSLTFEEEVAAAFARLADALAAQQLSLAHIAHINLSLASQADFGALNSVYARLFGSDPPSRACIALGDSVAARVTLDALAMDDGQRYAQGMCEGSQVRERRVVHVQGRSYWAAANIGPYSQAVKADGRISIAGQIGLVPVTLALEADAATQLALSLQHARRILAAVLEARTEKRRGWAEGCICWLESPAAEDAADAVQAASRRLQAARRAWLAQDAEAREDEEEREESWEAQWLGEGLSAATLPTVFAFLPHKALPRGACVEWQLTAHDGRTAYGVQEEDDDEDEQEEGEAGAPTVSEGRCTLPSGQQAAYRTTASRRARSSFGLAFLRKTDAADGASTAGDCTALQALVSGALSLRVLYRADLPWAEAQAAVDELLAATPAASRPALTPMPVCGLYDGHSGVAWDVVLAWTGV